MKKSIAIGLASTMLLASLTGCGAKKSEYLYDIDYNKYVTLCDYKGVEAEQVTFKITEDAIDEEIDSQMYDYANYDEITDRGVETGDYVSIDFKGTIDGKESENYSGQEEVPVGQEYFYPEVEEALIGKKTGDVIDVKIKLTEDWAEEGDVGKELTMKVTVEGISQENIPELTDDFVKENMEYGSVKEYREVVEKQLMESKTEEYKQLAIDQIMEYVVTNSKFDGYPQEIYDKCKESFDAENEQYAAMYGMEVEEMLQMMGMDEAACKEAIEESVHYELAIGAIAVDQGIGCTEKEIDDYVEKNYDDFGFESKQELLDEYPAKEIGYQLIYEKVMEYLIGESKKKEISEEEYYKRLEAEDAMFEEEGEGEEISVETEQDDAAEEENN